MSGEWIDWKAGQCPVLPGTRVDVKDLDGFEWTNSAALQDTATESEYWTHDCTSTSRIVAYRLHVPKPVTPATPRIAAHEFLERGVKHMRDRAVQRDSDAGERSMARAVAAFNAQEGTNLTEAQGWRFMIQLKYARAVNGVFVADDYEDLAAYAGLAAEAAQ